MGILVLLARLINLLTGAVLRSSVQELDRLQVLYAGMGDEQLRAELAKVYMPDPEPGPKVQRPGWLFRSRESPELHALAIALILFDRHPCDLPAGSHVYDEQRAAALLLLEGANVQMDTGEGKTYAVALASAALLAAHPQVVVVTANQYLARRDLDRVSSFFQAAGINSAFGVQAPDFRGVTYTDLPSLCFEYLHRTYRTVDDQRPGYPIESAVIIDEIDSVLLDQSSKYSLHRELPSDQTLWAEVFRLTEGWDERRFTYDRVTDRVSLTAEAWEDVADLSRVCGRPASMLMDLVSGALWAKQARPGRNYVVDGNHVRLINQITGAPFDSADPSLSALEHLLFGRNPSVDLTVAEIDALSLLRRHPLVVGLSGTVVDDTIYYLQQFHSLTAQVPPRFKRHGGRTTTLISPSRDMTFDYICKRIREAAPRPVVIGAWSAAKAHELAEALLAEGVVAPENIGVITAFDSTTDVRVLDLAGVPGRVTVMSQGGARGVDVRSTHRPLLLILGRAVEPRLDRQFLGRVGRHGEPFDADFVVDESSPLWASSWAASARIAGDVIELPKTAARAMRQAQRDAWTYRTRSRQRATVLSATISDIEMNFAARFRSIHECDDMDAEGLIAELLSPPVSDPRDGGGDSSAADAQAGARQAEIAAAVQRRRTTDSVVERFKTAIRMTDPGHFGSTNDSFMLKLSHGDPSEMVALTTWIGSTMETLDSGAENGRGELFREQVRLATDQRLPAQTTPHWRGVLDVVHETSLMANVTLLNQIKRRLDWLRVNSTAQTFHRRAAFSARNLHELSELQMRRELAANLAVVDRPQLLDDLYYSRENMLSPTEPSPRTPADVPLSPHTSPARVPRLSTDDLGARIQAFLAKQEDAGIGSHAPQEARLLLLQVVGPLVDGSMRISPEALRSRVNLIIDSLVARGLRGALLREHRRVVEQFIDELHRDGVLPISFPHESVVVGALRRARRFMATVPRWGMLAVLAFVAVLGVGFLPVAAPTRRLSFVDATTSLFGFGQVLPDHPMLAYLGVLIALLAVGGAARLADPVLFMGRVAPLVAVGFALGLYPPWEGRAATGLALLVGLLLWSAALLGSARLVTTLIGVDVLIVVAGVSVSIFVVGQLLDGRGFTVALIGLGVLAAVTGPGVPVTIGSDEYANGRFTYADERTTYRIRLDPVLTSAFLAFAAVALVVGVQGRVAVAAFVGLQIATFAFLATRRLRLQKVESLLARMRVGSPLAESELKSRLGRAAFVWVLGAAALLVACVGVAWAGGVTSTTSLLLAEWAGPVLVSCALSAGSAFSVGGVLTPTLEEPNDEGSSWKVFREAVRDWRHTRFAVVWRIALVLIILARPLVWLADGIGLVDAAQTAWNWVTGIGG